MYWRKPNYQHPQIASQDRTYALYECQPYTTSRRKTKNYGLNIVSKFHKPNVKQKNRMTISVTVLGHNTKIRRKTDQTNQKKKPQICMLM